MTAAYFPWAAELLLECAGAALNFRRSRLLAFILTVCAITDIAAFLVFQLCARSVYVWASWAQFALKELLLIWLACSICGMFVAEQNKSHARISTAFLSIGCIAMVVVFAFQAETLKNRLLDGEIAANSLLLGFILLGWIGRKDKLSADWKRITGGFILMVGGDLVFTLLWYVWDGARFWYPLSTICAQALWAVSPLLPHKLADCRLSLPKKYLDVEKVRVM